MKKLFCGCFAICILMITASADIIWEPESSFYKWHRNDCEEERRVYWVNSPEGYTTVWDEPDGTPIANLPNGELLHIYYRYQGTAGDWGIVECDSSTLRETALTLNEETLPEQGRFIEIWVPMEDLVNRYDHQSFLEEYAGELLGEERTVEISGLMYCTYPYPGGPLIFQQTKSLEVHELTLSPIYVDAEGQAWGHCGYFYGDRNVWFCISDPENPDLTGESREPELYPAATGSPSLPAAGVGVSVWLITAVVLLCGVTAILIVRMGRGTKGEKNR